MSEIQTKQCSRCNKTKPLSEFYGGPQGKPRAKCKACHRAESKVNGKGRYQRNPTAAKARYARWKNNHPDAVRQYSREGIRKIRQAPFDVGQEFFPLNDPKLGIAARRACKNRNNNQ